MYRSTDLVTWTQQAGTAGEASFGVSYISGNYIVTTGTGIIFTRDFSSWTTSNFLTGVEKVFVAYI